MEVHVRMAAALDEVVAEVSEIQEKARAHGVTGRPTWPMVILRTPKGWTGPKFVDGIAIEGTFPAHRSP